MRHTAVTVVGAGLAGSEAAWQIAEGGVPVTLFEMRPQRTTAAHTTGNFAELVCSNSLGSDAPNHASRLLKDEITSLGSLLIRLAREHSVPAGASLALDRVAFAEAVTARLKAHPLIEVRSEELTQLPSEGITVVATGPLTSPPLAESLRSTLGLQSLYFYDAISPIVAADSLDMDKLYFANRYGKGDSADFLNLPLTEQQYETLVTDLLEGDVMLPHDFEEEKYFEGCMPIEAIAARGRRTLAFGPLKPVGLDDPKTGRWPHAVIQLRAENRHRTAYNLVGFQTKLKYPEQTRIFRKLPGLENAEFLRLGSMHRNTYLNSPQLLGPTLQVRTRPQLFIAGQLTGTEGYLESIATGMVAGRNALHLTLDKQAAVPPPTTMLGALLGYISDPERTHFQPTNSNRGLLPPLPHPQPKGKDLRNLALGDRARRDLAQWAVDHWGSFTP